MLDIDFMPFREHEDGNWGMIGKDGKVLFSDEFKNKPTVAHHGRFWVKNNDGLWEMYTTDKKPQKIGEHYDQAGAFIENVAPVVPHNQPITFIDKNGDVKFTLTKVGDKTVTKCTNFFGGVAVFTAGGKQGCINTKGEVVLQPEYDAILPAFDGKMFAAKKDIADEDKITGYIISTSGEVFSSFDENKFKDLSPTFVSGLAVAEQKTDNDHQRAGLIDKNAEWVVKPNANFHEISQIYDGYFIFYDGDNYGLANKKGEIVIRPKYDKLKFAQKGKLLFAKGDYKDSEWELINFAEEKVGSSSFYDVEYFIGSLAPVEIGEHYWGFINSKGEVQDLGTMIYSLDVDAFGDTEFESQYIDVEAYANSLNIDKDGFLGLSLNQDAEDIFAQLRNLTSDPIGLEPKDFTYSTQITKTIPLEQSEGEFTAAFDGQFVNEKNNWTTDEWGYEYVESTEYSYNDKKPQRLELKIPRQGLLKGRMSPLTSQVISKVKTLGNVVKENKNAVLVTTGQRTWVVAYTGSDLVISCGNIDTSNFNIDAYQNVDEDSDVSFDITSSTAEQAIEAVDSAATVMIDSCDKRANKFIPSYTHPGYDSFAQLPFEIQKQLQNISLNISSFSNVKQNGKSQGNQIIYENNDGVRYQIFFDENVSSSTALVTGIAISRQTNNPSGDCSYIDNRLKNANYSSNGYVYYNNSTGMYFSPGYKNNRVYCYIYMSNAPSKDPAPRG